jgi:hypothetical protein
MSINKSDTNVETDNTLNSLDNNILRISEREQKVFLPYKYAEVENIFKMRGRRIKKYVSIEEVIADRFTLPLSIYRFPSISRFIEAFNITKTETSLLESFEIAIEVMQKFSLYPALIRACRNKCEFDILLDCFDKKEMDEFPYFKVVFEYTPTKVKKQKEVWEI